MELDGPGFHHSVLTDFRARLADEGRADKLLDLVLERIKAAGLVTERGRQRTDSTHILSAVRDLTRLELVTEAMRAALEELARQAPQELVGLVTEEWGTRYGRAARLGKNPTRPKTRIKNTGDDVYLLLRYVRTYLRTLWQGPQVQSPRQVFLQNFWIDERARVRWREPGDGEAGLPPSSIAIVSPYDLTTRYARRNETRWKGFLAHVTETCDDAVNIITDVTTTPATLYDIKALPAIHNRLAERNLLPGEHLVDGGYTSVVEQDQVGREHGITLVGPVRPKRTRQSRKGNVFDRDAFTIDWERQHAVCPQGKLSRQWATPPAITPYVQRRARDADGRTPAPNTHRAPELPGLAVHPKADRVAHYGEILTSAERREGSPSSAGGTQREAGRAEA